MKTMYTLVVFILIMLFASTTYAAGGKTVAYKVNGVDYEGYYAGAGAKAPLVLLVHDWDGLNDYEIKRAQMLADLGFAVFAADLFGTGVRPTKMEDMRRLTGELYQDRTKMRALLHGAVEAARAQGANLNNAVAMGYCFGGTAVLELARSGADLKGFVTFHGGIGTPAGQDYSKAKGNYLILHGSADTAVSMDDFANLAK